MAKARALNGKDLMIWIDGKVVALSKSCTINLKTSTMDSATKDDGDWDAQDIAGVAWSMSNESVDSADADRTNDWVYDELFAKLVSKQPVKVTYGVPTNQSATGVPEAGWTAPSSGKWYDGDALITALDREGAKGSLGSVTVSLTGYGALVQKSAG